MSGIATQRESSFLWLNTARNDRMTSVCKAYDEVLRQMVGGKANNIGYDGLPSSRLRSRLKDYRVECLPLILSSRLVEDILFAVNG